MLKESVLNEITKPEQFVGRIETLDEKLRHSEFFLDKLCVAFDGAFVVLWMREYPGLSIPQFKVQHDVLFFQADV